MIRDTVWLVTGHTGQRADYATWPVRVIVIEAVARKFAAQLTELSKDFGKNKDLILKMDPRYSNDSLYGPTDYTVEEVPHDECDGMDDAIVRLLESRGEVLTRNVCDAFEISFSEARVRLRRLAEGGRAHQIMLGWRAGPLPPKSDEPTP